MLEDKIILTICLPTYNRSTFIANQINFFQKEIEADSLILQKIRFIVGDNASTDETPKVLDELNKKHPFFEVITNDENLGLIGNVINLLNYSKSEYVWFVSDDDVLERGILLEVLNILKKYNNLEFIFLNFSADGEIGSKEKKGYIQDSKSTALSMFKERYGSLVFITSCVYKRETLLELKENPIYKLISAPLLFSFYSCSKGSMYVTEKVWVNFRSGNASYAGFKSNLKLKFEQYISILEFLPNFNYNEKEVFKIIESFLNNQSISHLVYNIYNFKLSVKLYKYYKIKTFLRIPVNVIKHIL
jgi:glycosyltransferase involved in cell wall biosynthesis